MPASSSSRRNARASSSSHRRSRVVEDDMIEDMPSQEPQVMEEVDEDEVASHTRDRNGRANVAGNNSNSNEVINGTDDQEEDERIDIANFEDQSLSRKDASVLLKFASEWEQLAAEAKRGGIDVIPDVAVALADGGGEHADSAVKKLDGMLRELLGFEAEMNAQREVLSALSQQIIRGEDVAGVENIWKEHVAKKKDEYHGKTSRQKYAHNESYAQFKQRVFEVLHEGEVMPPVIEMIPREEGDMSDDEDEIMIGGIIQDFKCPLTLTILEDPYTSKLCKHSYSGKAIKDYLGARHARKPCPAAGCNQLICMADLLEDKALGRRAQDYARRQRRRAEQNSENEEDDQAIDVE